MYKLKLFTLKLYLLKISVYLHTTFAAETHLTEGQWLKEQLNVIKLRYVPSRKTNAVCFEDRGAIFSARKDIY
jgi:hypothetical protein